ncbi:unnamed protein product [Absidia cylindrospora]
MDNFTGAHSPPSDEDHHEGDHQYAIKLANALKVKLQYARLKVSSGMTNKSFQEIEDAMTPRPPTPSSLHRQEDNNKMGEQEEAAARTIMMLSTNREKEKLQYQQQHGSSIYVPPDYVPTYFKVPSTHGVPEYQHHRPHPSDTYPPSLFDVVAKDQSYVQKSREMGHQLPRLSHDAKSRYHKHQRKKSQEHQHQNNHPVVTGKDPFQSIPITKPYTAPRRGRPKKSAS